jgi:uncharacterized protein VcgC/VcgE DUF2780
MNRRAVIGGFALMPLIVTGCASTESITDPLAALTGSLGLTQNQAACGLGSVLTLAQEKLVKGDFDKVAAAIPGASRYLDQAKSLGAVVGPIGNLAGLNSALGRLGISPDTAAKFVPAVTDLVSKAGGSSVGNLLSGVLG